MIPTIDLGVVAALGFVLNWIAKAWHIFIEASKYALNAAWAFMLGSKFWATVAFIGVYLLVVGFISTLGGVILREVSGYVLTSTFGSMDEFLPARVASQFIPDGWVSSIASFSLTCFTALYTGKTSSFVASRFYMAYRGVCSAWKT